MLQFGFPTRNHHQSSAEFRNHLFNYLDKLYDISTSKTIPYHPMSNGLSERIDTAMFDVLKTRLDNFKANWKDQLAKLTFAYNNTVNKSSGFTHFYLMFGRALRMSILDKISCYVTLKKKEELES